MSKRQLPARPFCRAKIRPETQPSDGSATRNQKRETRNRSMDWFYGDSGKQIGPIDDASFEGLVTAGIIRDETLVWGAGRANWQPYQTIRPVAQPTALEGAPGEMKFCSECGRSFAPDDLVA